MFSIKVFDLPTRLFHWILAFGFTSAFLIATYVDDESLAYNVHKGIGLVLTLAVLLRILWGIVGSTYARFSHFELHPAKLFAYMKNFFSKRHFPGAAHNAASSWAAIVMMACTFGLGVSGFLMTTATNKEDFEDIHDIFSDAFFVTAVVHVLGVIVHQIKHKDSIWKSMLTGKKNLKIEKQQPVLSNHTIEGLFFMIIVVTFSFYLFNNFNPETGKLNLFGVSMQMNKIEDE